MEYTSEQVLSLSPNDGNATRGKKLANTAKWPILGANESGIWGEAKGSGSKPYLTAVDFNGPAFKCSCPSREFPCKHAIGLLLLYVNEIDAFTELNMPQWVEEWISTRTKKEVSKTKIDKAPVDKEAQAESKAKRAAKRKENMTAGLVSLETWLEDIVEQGFGSLDPSNTAFWIEKGKELTNAQCPTLGNRLQQIPALLRGGNWVEHLLVEMGYINLLIQGFKQLDKLPPLLQHDIFNQLGVNTSKEELQTLESIDDQWLILSVETSSDGNLAERKAWLYGMRSEKYAMLLDFSYGGRQFDFSLPNGKTIAAEIIYYPSATPQRALIKGEVKNVSDAINLDFEASFEAVTLLYAQKKTINPFIREIPFALEQVELFLDKKEVLVKDLEGNRQLIHLEEAKLMVLLSITGAQPFGVFGTYQKTGIVINSILFDETIINL